MTMIDAIGIGVAIIAACQVVKTVAILNYIKFDSRLKLKQAQNQNKEVNND